MDLDYKKLLKKEEYKFLYENEHLKDKILFLVLNGSISHGTNIETSDVDIRGVFLESFSSLIGTSSFEQYTDSNTDTVIYSLTKFINLLISCNPNIIEMLFCEKEHYLYISPLGQLLLDNRDLFLSKKAIYTFKGFANSQMNKLENILVRKENIGEEFMNNHINRSTDSVVMHFIKNLNLDDKAIKVYLENNEVLVDFNVNKYPLKSLYRIVEQMSNVLRSYSQKKNNVDAKYENKRINKFMMHHVRTLLMLDELLLEGTFHTYRKNDRELLLNIRNGKYRNEDGTINENFINLVKDIENKIEDKTKTTKLKNEPDIKKINDLVQYIFKEAMKNGII